MININRERLLSDLYSFASEGSGLLVGKPGVGKSFMSKELQNKFIENDIPAELIKIDDLNDATDESINIELRLPGNWIEILKKIKLSNGRKALLIFDAFDAARNEQFREQILRQIKIARHELSEKWNIIVSVRTYDAAKSQELIKLFPLSDNYTDSINCRKTYIPELDTAEVKAAIVPYEVMRKFYEESTISFKEIIRTPYFLILANDIISNSDQKTIAALKTLRSETQLLKTYWDLRITSSPNYLQKEKALFDLLKILIGTKSLSCSKASFFETITPGETDTLEYLLRENIIHQVSIGAGRIAFSHNILFDYAVSHLYLQADTGKMLDFIKEDPTRPFFLRPSFVYFFTQLWYDDRPLYWQFYDRFSIEIQKEVQLFQRLVLAGVIASEYENLSDLDPILNNIDKQKRIQLIRYLLQSLRFVHKNTKEQDIAVLVALSYHLDLQYVFDYGFLLDRAVNDVPMKNRFLEQLGIASRNFLHWILDQRKTDLKALIDRLGAGRGIELVSKTYSSDITASKTLLEEIFEMFKEPGYEIYYFMNLCECIKDILEFDPQFVADVYLKIFQHEETSDERTTMGSSVIATFTSNRRQDFEMCYFRLVQFYPEFVAHSPNKAIPVGLIVVNQSILSERKLYTSHVTPVTFKLKDQEYTFIADNSSLWYDQLHYHKAAQLAGHITSFFSELLKKGKKEDLLKYLDLYVKHAQYGYTWKMLISFGVSAIADLSEYFFPFCITNVFMASGETYYEIGQLIEAGSEYFSEEQIKQIEQTIHELAASKEKTESTLSRFLSRIPSGKLQLKESKDYIEQHGTRENEKPFEFTSSSGEYSTEMWLEDRAVDIKDTNTKELVSQAKELSDFNSRWLNHNPPRTEYEQILSKATGLFEKIKLQHKTLHNDVTFTVLNDIAQTFTIISRDISSLTTQEFEKTKEAIYFSFAYNSEYDKSDEETSPSRGYSSTPKINSAEALAFIASREPDKEALDKTLEGINHPNGIIRFNASRHLDVLMKTHASIFYQLLLDKVANEKDAMIASSFLNNLSRIPYKEEQANAILTAGYSNEKLFGWSNSFIDNFTHLASWYAVSKRNAVADQMLTEAFKKEEFCRSVIFHSFEEFRINSLGHYENSEYFITSTIKWTLNYLDNFSEQLKQVPEADLKQENEIVKKCLSFFDLVVQRAYFVLDNTIRGNRPIVAISEENSRYLYFKMKPVLEKVQLASSEIQGGGLVAGHTAHYFIQLLNIVLPFDTKDVLNMATKITLMAARTGYTFDSMAIQEVVSMTEKLLADHRQLIAEDQASFDNLIMLLDLYINSGWIDALELLWKLDEIFK